MKEITSSQNPWIKLAASLRHKKYREHHKLFLAEGIRLCEVLLASGWDIYGALVTPELVCQERGARLLCELEKRQIETLQVPTTLYCQVGETEHPQGILLLAKQQKNALAELRVPMSGMMVIADALQDPGNLGTLIRTAVSVGAFAVLLTTGTVDVYNAKTIRASMGAAFHIPIVEQVQPKELTVWAKQQEVELLVADVRGAEAYFCVDYTKRVAVVLGNEGQGVGTELLAAANRRIFIPMLGEIESLNAATASAVILHEALRQQVMKGQVEIKQPLC